MRVHWPKFWCFYTIHLAAKSIRSSKQLIQILLKKTLQKGVSSRIPFSSASLPSEPSWSSPLAELRSEAGGGWRGKACPGTCCLFRACQKSCWMTSAPLLPVGLPAEGQTQGLSPRLLLLLLLVGPGAAVDAQLFVTRLAPRQAVPRSRRSRLKAHEVTKQEERCCLWNVDPSFSVSLCSGEETMRRWPAAEVCPRKDLGWALL